MAATARITDTEIRIDDSLSSVTPWNDFGEDGNVDIDVCRVAIGEAQRLTSADVWSHDIAETWRAWHDVYRAECTVAAWLDEEWFRHGAEQTSTAEFRTMLTAYEDACRARQAMENRYNLRIVGGDAR